MHIAIAGGSGFIGQALVKHLKQQHKITVISRDPSRILTKKLFEQPIQVVSWDSLGDLHGVDVVINLAGENLFSGLLTQSKKDRILQSRLTTTQKLVDWLKIQKTPMTFMCASGVNIYPANSAIHNENESISNQESNGFMITLAKQWEQVANQAKSEKCRVINLRQAIVLGKSGGMLAKILPVSRYFSGVILGEGQQPFLWVALTDVIRAIDFLMQHPTIQGPVNIVAPQILTQAEFAKQLAAKFGKPCFIRVPAWFLKMMMRDLADELILTSPKVEPGVLKQHGFEFKYPSLEDFLREREV